MFNKMCILELMVRNEFYRQGSSSSGKLCAVAGTTELTRGRAGF